jgi:hypothetical protein
MKKEGSNLTFQGIPEHLARTMIEFHGQMAWEYPNVLEVVDWLSFQGIAVLGGDVLRQESGALRFTGDNWYVSVAPELTPLAFVTMANKRAKEYIASYQRASDHKYLFSLTCESNPC